DLELTPVELDRDQTRRAAQEGGHSGAARPGARGERLPHAALEDPRPHPAAVDPQEGDVGAVGEELVSFYPGPDLGQVKLLELVADENRALRVADRDVLELPLAASGRERAPTVLPAGREILRFGRCPTHVHRAGPLGGDRRRDRSGGRLDRERVLVGPAA